MPYFAGGNFVIIGFVTESRDKLAQIALASGFISLAFVVFIIVGFLNILPADMASLMMLLSLVCSPVFGLLAIIIALIDSLIHRQRHEKPRIKIPLILGSSGIFAVGLIFALFLLLSHTLKTPW